MLREFIYKFQTYGIYIHIIKKRVRPSLIYLVYPLFSFYKNTLDKKNTNITFKIKIVL